MCQFSDIFFIEGHFEVVIPGRVYYLTSNSTRDAEEWVKDLLRSKEY